MRTFAENLLHHRTAAGLSQEALARAVDVALRTMHRYETGQSTPNVPTLVAIASALGCGVEDLTPSADAEARDAS